MYFLLLIINEVIGKRSILFSIFSYESLVVSFLFLYICSPQMKEGVLLI